MSDTSFPSGDRTLTMPSLMPLSDNDGEEPPSYTVLKRISNRKQENLTSDFVVAHIKVAVGINCKAAGSHAPAELVEHTGVVHPSWLLKESQYPVGHHLRHISRAKNGETWV